MRQLSAMKEVPSMTKHVHHSNPSAAPTPFLAAPWFNVPMVDALTRAGESCTKACQAWQEEVVRFTASRLECDSELGRKLVACRNWADAAKLQQDWAAITAQDYLNEANRMTQLASKFGAKVRLPAAPGSQSAVSERQAHAAE
jgi:hypothetical protein